MSNKVTFTPDAIRSVIRSDTTSTLKGFIYQFLVALKACLEMKTGQSVYVERYGDVAIISDDEDNGVSIEVKQFQKALTPGHANLLNTLFNWCQDGFHQDNYSNLFLFTSQSISDDSDLRQWNDKSSEKRYELINTWFTKHKQSLADRLKTEKEKNEKADYSAGAKKTIEQIDYLLAIDKKDIVLSVVGKFTILYQQPDYVSLFDELKNRHGNVVEESKQDLYMCSLLGGIINPHIVEEKWEISKQGFSKILQDVTSMFSSKMIFLPEIEDPTDDEKKNLDKSLFVKKLKDIEIVEEDIAKAIYNFAKTNKLIIEKLKLRPYGDKELSRYQDNLKDFYDTEYSSAKLGFEFDPIKNVIKSSKLFYYHMLGKCINIVMAPYGQVDVFFSQGMLHIMANDEELDIKWEVS